MHDGQQTRPWRPFHVHIQLGLMRDWRTTRIWIYPHDMLWHNHRAHHCQLCTVVQGSWTLCFALRVSLGKGSGPGMDAHMPATSPLIGFCHSLGHSVPMARSHHREANDRSKSHNLLWSSTMRPRSALDCEQTLSGVLSTQVLASQTLTATPLHACCAQNYVASLQQQLLDSLLCHDLPQQHCRCFTTFCPHLGM